MASTSKGQADATGAELGSTIEDTMQSQLETVYLRFVLNEGYSPETCPSVMLAAFQQCEDQGLDAQWMKQEDLLSVKDAGKKDIFVVEPFEGPAFEHVHKLGHTKCVVIGPRCLTYCLLHKLPLPDYLYPMHNMAMHNIVVTCTGCDKAEKEQIKKLVQFMAGVYSNDFHQSITHLIAGSVGTSKYKVAMAREVPVMQASWVSAVWAAMGGTSSAGAPAAGGMMAATDQKFLLSHVCPVFLKQVVCVSQLPKKDKLALQKLIEENGGVYSATLDMDHTTLLVLLSAEGEKYNHAVRWKVPCVTPEYIYDSVQAGYALDVDKYKLKRKASTPTKQSGKMLPPDVSMVSAINVTLSGAGPGGSHVDETMAGENTFMAARPSSRQPGAGITNDTIVAGVAALDQLSLSDVGQCGLFLDGCKVYLSGWAAPGATAGARVEKLRKLLNLGGATRFNQLTDAVSHVVMGSFQGDTVSTVGKWCSKPHLVSASWLIESLKQKRPADEAAFSCVELADVDDTSDTVLPPRRRQRVSETVNDTTIDFHNRENDRNCNNVLAAHAGSPASFGGLEGGGAEEDDLVKQYMKAASGGAEHRNNSTVRNDSMNASTVLSSQASQAIFGGLSFLISGYESEILAEVEESLSRSGARVLTPRNYDGRAPVDYCLVTQDGQGLLAPTAKHYVTHVFAEECYEEERVVPVQFYHLPLLAPLERCPPPLEGVVLAMSTYTGREKHFLVHLTNLLGAKFQEMFARKDNSSKGVLRCTHLICPAGTGDKYRASVKWGTPALTRDWLLAAARDWALPDEAAFAAKDGGSQQELPALQIIRHLLDEHISSKHLSVPEPLNDSTMIAPTPVVSNKVLSLRGMGGVTPSARGGRPGTFTTPGKPTTPSAVHTPDLDTLRGLYPTPGRPLTTNDSLDAMPTPETPYGRTWEPNPSARTRKAHKRLLENLPENNYEIVAKYLKKQESATLEQNKQMTANIIAVLGYDPNESGTEGEAPAKRARTEAQGNTRQGPLKDCVLYVSKKFENIQSDLHAKVKELGGQFRWSYDATVTHYIYGGKALDKEGKLAKDAGKSIVSAEWVIACCDRQAWVDESSYPYCHNPNMSLTVVSERRAVDRAASSKKHTDNVFVKRSTNLDGSYLDGLQQEAGPNPGNTFGEYEDLTNLDTDLTAKGLAEGASKQPVTGSAGGLGHKAANAYVIEETVENTQVARELEELEQLAANSEPQSQNCDGVESKGASATPVALLQRNRNSVSGSGVSRRRSVRRRRSEDREEEAGGSRDVGEPITTVGTMELPGGSQMTNIAWADPMDREARAKLSSAQDDRPTADATAQEEEDNDATQPFELPNETDCEEAPAEEEEQPPPAPQLLFVISNAEAEEREQLTAVVASLGGAVLDDVTPAMTHLITTRPTRSEKHLTAIAAGKWVLPPLYLWQCHQAGAFIEESPYEWGNPANSERLPSAGLKETEMKLAAAAHRWRVALSRSGGGRRGAFSGWRALVASTPDRAAAFVRLLEAGGGTVYTEGDLLDSSVAKATCSCHGVALNFCPDFDRRASSAFNTTQRRISESNFPRDLTHCFVEMKRNPKFDLALFAQHQVPCLEPMFINNFLLSESPLDPHHCCIPLYKEIVSNLTKKPALLAK